MEKENEVKKLEHAVAIRDVVIAQLRDELAGHYEVQKILSAWIVVLAGEGKGRVSRSKLNEMVGDYEAVVTAVGDELEIELKKREG